MLDFLSQVTREFGVGEGTARHATGGLLKVLQQNSQKSDFSALLSGLPGAEQLLKEAPAESATSGGAGGLLGKASSLLGGRSQGALGALSSLSAAGLDVGDIPKFASQFLAYAKSQAGEGVVQSVLENLPDLKKLL